MESRDFLSTLPDDALGVIVSHLDPESIINLDLTAPRYHTLFTQNDFAKLKIKEARKIINQFFTLVAFALLKVPDKNDNTILVPALENFLKHYPELLTYRLTVQCHPKIKLVDRTAYQITLAYAAANIYPMIEKHFLRLPNGKEEMQKQLKEQFPDGVIKAYPKYDVDKARKAFCKAKELIKVDECISYKNGEDYHFLEVMSKNTREAINEFFTLITGYDLAIMTDNKLEKNIIEFKCVEGEFKYRVIGLDNEEKAGSILLSELSKDFPNQNEIILARKSELLPVILKFTCDANHTILASDNEYTIGLVNDMQLYNEGLAIYKDEIDKFKDWPQRDAYCVFMLGGLQALFTPNILQVLFQSAHKVINQKEALAYLTSTRFRGCDVSLFNPYSQFRLGEHFFIDNFRRLSSRWCAVSPQRLENSVEQMQLALNNLCSDSSPQMSVPKM